MKQPIITTAGPYPNSFIGIHFDHFLRQVEVHTAPHPLHLSRQRYIPESVYEEMRLHLLAGPVTAQQLSQKAKTLFGEFTRMHTSQLFGGGESDLVIAEIAHQIASYSYLAARSDSVMYDLYARVHDMHFLKASETNEEKRDNAYRVAWGHAHYAQIYHDRAGPWVAPWSSLSGALDQAHACALRTNVSDEHFEALREYLKIARGGPSASPLNLDEVLNALNPDGAAERFRGLFMAELKRFLATKGKEFPMDQHLKFTPFEALDDGSPGIKTILGIKDADSAPNSYTLLINVNHVGGFNEESGKEVGAVAVSIRDDR